jgi:4'-phosphopantetheinyl transferase
MQSTVWVTDIALLGGRLPQNFCERLSRITEELPLHYRKPEDILRHEVGICMAAALIQPNAAAPLTVGRGIFGKPFFREYPNRHFNISHSGRWVVCAVSDLPVGVDIQTQTPLAPESWRLFMTKSEIQSCTDSAQALRLWSVKEAVAKCIGCGFLKSPAPVGSIDTETLHPLRIGGEWYFLWQQLCVDSILSVCLCRKERPTVRPYPIL